jgi:hypothetical protein
MTKLSEDLSLLFKVSMTAMVAQELVTVMFNRVWCAMAAMPPASSYLPLVKPLI